MKKSLQECKFCHQKLVLQEDGFGDGYYFKDDNEIELVDGNWTVLYIGVNENGEVVMRACGDGYTDDYLPKYCPECGRKLVFSKDR